MTLLGAVLPEYSRLLLALSAACVLAAVIFWLILGHGRPDSKWFDARAVAESVKTMTWRYVTGADPYPLTMSALEADQRFLAEVGQVLKMKPNIAPHLDCAAGSREITDAMRNLRNGNLQDRLALYLERRVRDQKSWYSDKAKYNRTSAGRWHWTAFVLQIVALVFAGLNLVRGAIDYPGFFVTIAALVISWLQVQQYAHLAHTYGLAAQEFALIETKGTSLSTEEDLAGFVEQAELAASREHTLWVARNVF